MGPESARADLSHQRGWKGIENLYSARSLAQVDMTSFGYGRHVAMCVTAGRGGNQALLLRRF
jgi:hypothetical protein